LLAYLLQQTFNRKAVQSQVTDVSRAAGPDADVPLQWNREKTEPNGTELATWPWVCCCLFFS